MRFPCPCCGFLVFGEPPGSFDICPICDWEDDNVQLRWPDWPGGANHPSLIEAQRHFLDIGVSDPRCQDRVRSPSAADQRDPGCHPISDRTLFEALGVKGAPFPSDPTVLYWWRPSFWRKSG